MSLHQALRSRAAAGRPVRAGLIGAGKFGTMFLAQVPTTPGLEVAAIADLSADRIRTALADIGWKEADQDSGPAPLWGNGAARGALTA